MIYHTLTLCIVFQIAAIQGEETNIYFQDDFKFATVNERVSKYYEAHAVCRSRNGIMAHFGNHLLYQRASRDLFEIMEVDRYYIIDLLYAKRNRRYYWPNGVSYLPHQGLLPNFPFVGNDTRLGCAALYKHNNGILMYPKSCDVPHYILCLIRENSKDMVNETDYRDHDFVVLADEQRSHSEARAACYEENGVLAYISNPTLSNIADQQLFDKLEVNRYYHVDLLCEHLCNHHYFPNARHFIANQQTYFIVGNPTTGVCLALFRYTNAISYRRVGCKQKAKTLCLVKRRSKKAVTTITAQSTTSNTNGSDFNTTNSSIVVEEPLDPEEKQMRILIGCVVAGLFIVMLMLCHERKKDIKRKKSSNINKRNGKKRDETEQNESVTFLTSEKTLTEESGK